MQTYIEGNRGDEFSGPSIFPFPGGRSIKPSAKRPSFATLSIAKIATTQPVNPTWNTTVDNGAVDTRRFSATRQQHAFFSRVPASQLIPNRPIPSSGNCFFFFFCSRPVQARGSSVHPHEIPVICFYPLEKRVDGSSSMKLR